MGVSNIITFDAHDPRVQNAIPTSGGFESVMPSYQIFKALLRKDKDVAILQEQTVIDNRRADYSSNVISWSDLGNAL